MEINILHNLDGAKKAQGLTVIIDVFRAFSLACYAFSDGAKMIIPVADIKHAYKLKQKNPNYLLIGERGGEKPIGFDYGNSPFLIKNIDLNNKTIIHTTSSGTQAITNAGYSDEIITGSFVNANAIIKYIKMKNPKIVSLVCTDTANEEILDEDGLCAIYIKNALIGKKNHFDFIYNHLKSSTRHKPFADISRPSHPIEDFDFCLNLNKFNFILKAIKYRDNMIKLKKIDL